MPLPAGSIKITKVVSGTLAVDITRVSGGSLTVYSDSALTTSVSMPDSITASKTYYLADADHYTVSVKRGGVEIASDDDSTLTVQLVDGQALNIAPTVDPNKVESAAEAASVAETNAFTGANTFTGAFTVGATGTDLNSAATAYTPTWTNLTVGNGTQSFKYFKYGRLVRVVGRLVFGSTTSITGSAPTFTLPVTSAAVASTRQGRGIATLFDSGTETYYGVIAIQTTTTAWIRTMTVTSNIVRGSAVDATNPFTWTTSDEIIVDFFYEAAA